MTVTLWGELGWHRSQPHLRIQSSSEAILNWTRAYELRRAGRPLKLERIPMELLLLLVESRGQLVTREQIIERIWGRDVFLDADTSINSAIRKIRQVLKDDPEEPKFIQTVTGRGYRFIGGVTDVAPLTLAPPSQAPVGPNQGLQSAGDLASPAETITQVRRLGVRFHGRAAQAAVAAVVLLLFLGAIGYWSSQRRSLLRPQFKTIAVLPLQNYSGDPQQEYFVDGMTDSVIADLGKIKDLRVISRTSVTPYKNSRKSMREIASDLHADAVIEGSVARSADRVRITVQLIDAARDQHLWSESYEREMKDIFALQSQVAQAIAEQVHAVVTPEEQGHLSKSHVIDPDVYELYLKGRHIMERGGLQDVRNAIGYFQSGLEKDPDNALLYTGLADAYIDKMMDVHESPAEATSKARVAAEKALQLDDSLAEAHTSLGMIKLSYDWDWAGAEHEFNRAIELNPGYPLAYVMYGQYLTMVGRQTDAVPYFEKAHKLDPLFGQSYRGEGYSCFMAHKYDEAIIQYRKALELEPDAITYFGLVLARAEGGDYVTAITEAEEATKVDNSPLLLTSLASAYARAGRRADANHVLRRLQELWERQGTAPAWHTGRSPYVCPYEVAGVYAQLRENDRAFDWLDKAYRNRSCLYWLRVDPRFDSIRPDPRFQELLAKMNFPK